MQFGEQRISVGFMMRIILKFQQTLLTRSLHDTIFPSACLDSVHRIYVYCMLTPDGWLQVFTYLILAAGAASAELLYLAYNGDKEVTWSEACGVFGGFCRQARTSVAITFGSVLCYILLSLISSYCLFSAYDAPVPSHGNKGVEIAAFPR